MNLLALAIAAVLLAAERACYVVVARRPDAFLQLYWRLDPMREASPIAIVERLFFAFKGLQFGVFIAWCYVHGGKFPFPAPHGPVVTGLAWALAVAGQVLVVSTFYRLGRAGVFFGDRLGYAVPRCRKFPFSLLSHPQYVGTLLTIWGGFMLVRFPNADWYALPVLETIYYLGGMWLETARPHCGARCASITFRMQSRAASMTEGSEKSRPAWHSTTSYVRLHFALRLARRGPGVGHGRERGRESVA